MSMRGEKRGVERECERNLLSVSATPPSLISILLRSAMRELGGMPLALSSSQLNGVEEFDLHGYVHLVQGNERGSGGVAIDSTCEISLTRGIGSRGGCEVEIIGELGPGHTKERSDVVPPPESGLVGPATSRNKNVAM
jgi:hypothetical protein